ncbi:MAG TPA: hypothetical protein VFA60_06325 [Terriglobales bacterium]|nr:hypothetical protein [Terriglobales bacterium]
MQTRRAVLFIALLALAVGVACSKAPEDQSASSSSAGAAGGSSASKPGVLERLTSSKLTVPAGTVITVRLNQSLGSKTSNAGDSFTANVEQPVEVDGKVAIPKDATVNGEVVSAKARGRFKGAASLQIAMKSIVVDGTTYPIQAGTISRAMKGKGKRTATLIGGGAGLGALIGGLAGGGKGAAIGAVAGAGAGTAGSAFTDNKDIVLPAESALSFKLGAPVEIKK